MCRGLAVHRWHCLPPDRFVPSTVYLSQTLIKRTKHGEEGDVDRRLAAGIMRSQRYKQADFDAGALGCLGLWECVCV